MLAAVALVALQSPALADDQLYINGATRDIVKYGTSQLGSLAETITPATHNVDAGITPDGAVRFLATAGAFYLDVNFSPDAAGGLQPGMYADAVVDGGPGRPLHNLPGISITRTGFGCFSQRGWVKVLESHVAANGSVDRYAADFVHYCDRDKTPLFGAYRRNSAIPFEPVAPYAVAGRDQVATEGDTVQLEGQSSFSFTDSPLVFSWRQASGPPVALSDAGAPRPLFTAPAVGPGGDTVVLELTVTDMAGASSTDAVSVQVRDTASPRTRAFIHAPAGEGIYYDLLMPYAAQGAVRYTFDEHDWRIEARPTTPYGFDLFISGAFQFNRDTGTDWGSPSGRIVSLFQVPVNQLMAPGLWSNTQGLDRNNTAYPYLLYQSLSLGCGGIGAFRVLEYESTPATSSLDMSVSKLAVDFEQRCLAGETTVYPPLTGSVRINSAIPLHDGLVPALAAALPIRVEFTMSPNPAQVGQPVTLSWNSTNAQYCYGFNGVPIPPGGVLATSGSVTQTYPAATTQLFTLACYTSSTYAAASVMLTVSPATTGGGGAAGGSAGGKGGGGALDGAWLALLAVASLACRRRPAAGVRPHPPKSLVFLWALLLAMPALAAEAPPTAVASAAEAARLEANKQLLLHDFALRGDLEARKRLRTDDYLQHNPRFVALTGPLGPEAWAKAIETGRGKAPLTDTDFNFRGTPVLVMAEGDLVTAIYKAVLPDPDHPGQDYEAFTFETVRIRDGKLAEHWDAAKLAKGWREPIDAAQR